MREKEMRSWPDFWDALAAKTRCVGSEGSRIVVAIATDPLSFSDDGVRFYDSLRRDYTIEDLENIAGERRRL